MHLILLNSHSNTSLQTLKHIDAGVILDTVEGMPRLDLSLPRTDLKQTLGYSLIILF